MDGGQSHKIDSYIKLFRSGSTLYIDLLAKEHFMIFRGGGVGVVKHTSVGDVLITSVVRNH